MSPEKVAVLRSLNATIIRTPTQAAWDSPESHIGVARRLQNEIPNAHILDQYGNRDNPLAHEYGTAEEIWTQTAGRVTAVVVGAGTGGTVTGIARGLWKHNPEVKIIAADPHGSVLALPQSLNDTHANESYKVEGIGYDFVPDVLDRTVVHRWYKTNDRDAFTYARRLIAEEGLLVGGSSGSAMEAMVQGVKDMGLGKDDVVVVILPDGIRSYLSKVSPLIRLKPTESDHFPLSRSIPSSHHSIELTALLRSVRRRRLACSERSPPSNTPLHRPAFANPPVSQVLVQGCLCRRHNPHAPSQTGNHHPLVLAALRRHRDHARQGLRPAPRALRVPKSKTSGPDHARQLFELDQSGPGQRRDGRQGGHV